MEHDIKVLRKILNSELFLGKYPMISRVFVDKYCDKIDIVMIPSETEKFWPIKDEITSYIWSLAKMSGVETRFNIYP